MITSERAHSVFLSVPIVEETGVHGHPDFRLNGKAFGALWPGLNEARLRVGKEEQFMLSKQSKVFSIPKGGERGGWIVVRLSAVSEEEFHALVMKAWHHTAPPRLSLQY